METYDFPEPDLMEELIKLFFTHSAYCVPLLHRPTFQRSVKEGLHYRDSGFAMTLLGVCALGARWSNDPRVLLEGTTSLHSSGYKWYRQMKFFHENTLRAPSIYELQAFCVSRHSFPLHWYLTSSQIAVMYLQGSSTVEKCWYLIGFGIRAALDIGLNLKPKYQTKPTIEGELRKRVWYTLMLAEMVVSATAGRTPSINPSECVLSSVLIYMACKLTSL